jgi:hypothetical protein
MRYVGNGYWGKSMLWLESWAADYRSTLHRVNHSKSLACFPRFIAA